MKTACNPGIVLCAALAVALASRAASSSGGANAAEPVADATNSRPAGEGVLCLMAIYSAVAEVGRRCFPRRDPAFQAELELSIRRMADYAMRNSEATREDLERFRRRHGSAHAPAGALCRGDPAEMYRRARRGGASDVRAQTDQLLSRPGPPTWGDCL